MKQRIKIIPNARAVARARVEAGYSQLDIARAAGIPNSSVTRAEHWLGVSAKTAASICKALGRKMDDLFTVNYPGSAADQARDSLKRGVELTLYVMIDKYSIPMDGVQQLAAELTTLRNAWRMVILPDPTSGKC